MPHATTLHSAVKPSIVCLVAALAACGGGGSGESPTTAPSPGPPAARSVTLQGVAAVGAPITGARVTLNCATAVATSPAVISTGSDGAWSASVPAASLPCAVRASGGSVRGSAYAQPLHSIAAAEGTVNITPLTDLIVALATRRQPAAWYDDGNPARLADALGNLLDAQLRLLKALDDVGLRPPVGLAPITSPFRPVAGDDEDAFLEVFFLFLRLVSLSYGDALNLGVASGGGSFRLPLPPLPIPR